MAAFAEIWKEQCQAALEIRERYGIDKALGYLVGEKLLNFIRAGDEDDDFAGELPLFVAEIRSLFEPQELAAYLGSAHRVGSLGHVASDEHFETLRAAGALHENVVTGAEEVLLMGRARELLLG